MAEKPEVREAAWLLAGFAAFVASTALIAGADDGAAARKFKPVTDAMLQQPPAADWLDPDLAAGNDRTLHVFALE